MEDLLEMVQLVTKKKIKKVDTFNEHGSKSKENLEYQLYDGIKTGLFTTDKEAAKALFNTSSKAKKYMMLRVRVKRKLMDSLFHISTKAHKYSESKKAYFKLHKELLSAKILLMNGASISGHDIMRKMLFDAQKYQFNDIVLHCSEALRQYCSVYGLHSDYEYYNSIASEIIMVMHAESISQRLLENININNATSVSLKPELVPRVRENANKVQVLRKKHKESFKISLNYFKLKLIYFMESRQHKRAIKLCREAETFLKENKAFYQSLRVAHFTLNKMLCLLYLKQYQQGANIAEESEKNIPVGTNTWFLVMEYLCLIAIHTKNFNKANEVLNTVKKTKEYKLGIIEKYKERWEVYEAYLEFFKYYNGTKSTAYQLRKLQSYCIDLPAYKKDKRGLYIAIFIYQIIVLLLHKDYDAIFKKSRTLDTYRYKHLREKDFTRSRYFIKLLLTMIKEGFRYKRTRLIGQKFCNKLLHEKLNYQGNMSGLEVIPYEIMWDIILHILEKQDKD